MTAVGLAGIGAAALRARKAGRRSRVSFGGMLAGLLTGLGGGVLLQQFAVIYPTRLVAVIYVLVGLLAGAGIPAFSHAFAVRSGSRVAPKSE